MPRPEDTLDQLARLARDDDALHAASERRPAARPSTGAAPSILLPESLTRPISEAQQSSFVAAIQARLANADRKPPPSSLVSLAGHRPSALLAAAALMAAVAGALLALRGSPDDNGPLSSYDVRLEGSEQTERGSTQALESLRLRPGSKLRFELRPSTDVQGSVHARLYLQSLGASGAQETRELEVTQEQSTAGALRVAARLPTPLSGRGTLLLYVGRPHFVDHGSPNDAPARASKSGQVQEFRWQFEQVP